MSCVSKKSLRVHRLGPNFNAREQRTVWRRERARRKRQRSTILATTTLLPVGALSDPASFLHKDNSSSTPQLSNSSVHDFVEGVVPDVLSDVMAAEVDRFDGGSGDDDDDDADGDASTEGVLTTNRRELLMPIDAVALTDELVDKYSRQLHDFAFVEWFSSAAGGSRSVSESKTMMRTIIRLLINVHRLIVCAEPTTTQPTSILQFAQRLICDVTTHRYMIDYLQQYPHKPNTMIQHLYHFQEFVKWMRRIPFVATTANFDFHALSFNDMVVGPIISTTKKTIRKEKRSIDRSRATAVFERRYPAGGLAQLRATLDPDVQEMIERYLGPNAELGNISAATYAEFCEVLFASLYVLAPQGRPGGMLFEMLWYSFFDYI